MLELAMPALGFVIGFLYAVILYNYFFEFKIPAEKEKALFHIKRATDPSVSKRIYEVHLALYRFTAIILLILPPFIFFVISGLLENILLGLLLFFTGMGMIVGDITAHAVLKLEEAITQVDLVRYEIIQEKEEKGTIHVDSFTG